MKKEWKFYLGLTLVCIALAGAAALILALIVYGVMALTEQRIGLGAFMIFMGLALGGLICAMLAD